MTLYSKMRPLTLTCVDGCFFNFQKLENLLRKLQVPFWVEEVIKVENSNGIRIIFTSNDQQIEACTLSLPNNFFEVGGDVLLKISWRAEKNAIDKMIEMINAMVDLLVQPFMKITGEIVWEKLSSQNNNICSKWSDPGADIYYARISVEKINKILQEM